MASIHHFADPHELLKTEYNNTSNHKCDICRSKMAGLTGYRCGACDFDIHKACAEYFKETISFFAHPWHNLTLTRIPSSSGDGWRWYCDLCREDCPPGHLVYRCVRCSFDVHPLCTMLPQTIRSPVHPAHDLCMVPSSEGRPCSACSEGVDVWQYRCGFCHSKLHIACASGAPRTRISNSGGQQSTTTAQGQGSSASQASSSGNQQRQSHAVTPTPSRSSSVAKFLLKTSFRVAINAATGGLASPVLEVLSWAFS